MKKRTVLLSVAATVLAGVAAFGWMIIRRGFSARENPSTMEAYIARTARKLSIPASERDAEEPVAPTLVRVRRAGALRIKTQGHDIEYFH